MAFTISKVSIRVSAYLELTLSDLVTGMNLSSRPWLPEKVYAEVVLRSGTGISILDTNTVITSQNILDFHADPSTLRSATQRLIASGFEVLDVGNLSISILGTPEAYEQSFGSPLEAIERPTIKEWGQPSIATFINAIDDAPFGQISPKGSSFQDIISGVVINQVLYYLQVEQLPIPSSLPPVSSENYLSIPDQLVNSLNAEMAHRQGITGKGVKVVMVDSGWYNHPYFQEKNYNVDVQLAPGSIDKFQDESGHGTGESANLLAIAPGISLTMVKADIAINGKLRNINSVSALRTAAALKPDIISCSWGSDQHSPILSPYNRLLAATVADLVRQNIIVIFAAGNGQWSFPAQHPEVIAVGGAYLYLDGSLRGTLAASNYASSFVSPVYPERQVPDVCGLVGQLPSGKYILLPVPPGGTIDQRQSEMKDGTSPTDGWAAFSGTSAAAPQVAGICALLKQLNPSLSPAQAKRILQQTARDVVNGFSNPASGGAAARDGPDLATGYGLVDAQAAIQTIHQEQLPRGGDRQTARPTIDFSSSATSQLFQEQQTMSSQFPKLAKQLDEIFWKFETTLQDFIRTQGLEDVELSIGIDAFIERSPVSKIAFSLRQSLNDCLVMNQPNQSGSSVDASKINQQHLSAAQGLIKLGRYQHTSIEVLTQALGSSHPDIKALASQALSDCSSEIASFDTGSGSTTSFFNVGDPCGCKDSHCYVIGRDKRCTKRTNRTCSVDEDCY